MLLNRYKVNVYAIDDSGSASLVLFDGSLLPFIGKNAEELQAAMDEVNFRLIYKQGKNETSNLL